MLDLDTPQLKGITTLTGKPAVAAIHGMDLETVRRSEVAVESKLSSDQGRSLLALLGLERAIAAGEGLARFEGSASGAWGAPIRLKAKISGAASTPKRKAPLSPGRRSSRPA